MRPDAARRLIHCASLTALATSFGAATSHAQTPQLAAEGELSTSTSPEVFQSQAQVTSAGASADTGGTSGDYIYRYKPEANMFEAGAFLGALFISDNNSFRGPTVVTPGQSPDVKPISNFEPAVEIGLRGGYFPLSFLGAELEGMLASAQAESGGDATVLAGRAQIVLQSPLWSIVPFVVGGAGIWNVRNEISGDDTDPAFHYGGGAKVNVTENLAVRFDVRDTITNQRGGGARGYPHNIEALAGANLVFGRTPQVGDRDGDGVLDDRDQCPVEAGTLPDGCPVRDSDRDGVLDPDDRCVMEAGVAPSGCPVRDADQDGVPDEEDQCIQEAGGAPTGCPDGDGDGFLDRADQCPEAAGVSPDGCPADADGDGILGAVDRCPEQAENKNGFEDDDGCPDEIPATVQSFMGVIPGVEFDNNQAQIRSRSLDALDKAIEILKQHPSLRVEIIGHTDNTGGREYNVELSRQRAESVKQHLVSRGIEPTRIMTRGQGPDVPITTNGTAAGRQKNRRIEFRVIE